MQIEGVYHGMPYAINLIENRAVGAYFDVRLHIGDKYTAGQGLQRSWKP